LYDLVVLWGQVSLSYVDSTRISADVKFPVAFSDVGAYTAIVTPSWQAHQIFANVHKSTNFMSIQALSGSGGFQEGYSRTVNYVVLGRIARY